jgi:hypothetical protein
MAGKPSKWSTDVTINSIEEDDEWNLMSMDRSETRRHFEHNEIQSPEDKEYESVIENQKRLRGFHEEPNTKGKTWRRVR